MSIDGLWTIEFRVAGGWRHGGVVAFESGRFFGGDRQYYYIGSFSVRGDELRGQAQITHHSGPVLTAWGANAREFSVELRGKRDGDTIMGDMGRLEAPEVRQPIRVIRRAPLP
jgi:hypothetical protein